MDISGNCVGSIYLFIVKVRECEGRRMLVVRVVAKVREGGGGGEEKATHQPNPRNELFSVRRYR